MAWVLVTGEDAALYENASQTLQAAGHAMVAAPDGATALQLLVDVVRHMVVLVRRQMGQMDAADFLCAVAADDHLRWRHVYILLDGIPGQLPPEVERYCAELAVPVVATPTGASDEVVWADLLDAIEQLADQLPSEDSSTTR